MKRFAQQRPFTLHAWMKRVVVQTYIHTRLQLWKGKTTSIYRCLTYWKRLLCLMANWDGKVFLPQMYYLLESRGVRSNNVTRQYLVVLEC